jgi:hypothetical protein
VRGITSAKDAGMTAHEIAACEALRRNMSALRFRHFQPLARRRHWLSSQSIFPPPSAWEGRQGSGIAALDDFHGDLLASPFEPVAEFRSCEPMPA